MKNYYIVAVEAPLPAPLTYLAPRAKDAELTTTNPVHQAGTSVTVPLGARQAKGVILGTTDDPGGPWALKAIKTIVEDRPQLSQAYLNWTKWLAEYYLSSQGQILALSFPSLKKKSNRKSKRKSIIPELKVPPPPQLNQEQISCVASILKTSNFATHLLHGVTGSGKTEVYMTLLKEKLKADERALILVPEISLTPQLVSRFSARFPNQVSVLHSQLTPREKTNQWWEAIEGTKPILIGARSALFCPLHAISLIIVDEEHDPSFKQDEKFRYNGRDAAIMLARFHNCPIILGSATPSLESWQNVAAKKYHIHQMLDRVSNRPLPAVKVIDLRDERKVRKEKGNPLKLPFWLGEELFLGIQKNLQQSQQSALFLNRRGIAQTVICSDCGHIRECPNCAISLTLHGSSHMVCHYCDYSERLIQLCPKCSTGEVQAVGLGTELIETELQQLFPDARIARADRDEISNREGLETLIQKMECHEIDILVGTQMIAKGLDFPLLTLVGIVLADVGLNMPDFRTSERIFQLLTQVSGRSGRHTESPGQVLIQTYNPTHPSIVATKNHDFPGFAAKELELRKELKYPPFEKLIFLKIISLSESKVQDACQILLNRAQSLCKKMAAYQGLRVLGPAPSPLLKIRNKYRYQMLIKSNNHQTLKAFVVQILNDSKKWLPKSVQIQVDVDPINML